MSTRTQRTTPAGTIQYLIDWDARDNEVPLSLFFHDGGHGVIHGLYFGDAGGACRDDACFRMVISEDGDVSHFLECEDPTDEVFLRDRADDESMPDQPSPLNDEDAGVLAMLQTFRASWWRFTEDADIAVAPARLGQFLAGSEPHLRSARSASLDLAMVARVSGYWSLCATITVRP